MNRFAAVAASTAIGIILGRLSTRPHLRHLRTRLRYLDGQLRVARHLASHDRLTGLPNRSAAATFFLVTVEIGRRPTILALVDLDRLKPINDRYGYHAGDELIRTAAARLARAARQHGGFAARLGGDEFLILLPADGAAPAAPVVAILEQLAQPAILGTDEGDIRVPLNASTGISIYDGIGDITFTEMLHRADIALHHAKHQRGSHRRYEPGMQMPRNAGRHGPRRRDQHPADGQAPT